MTPLDDARHAHLFPRSVRRGDAQGDEFARREDEINRYLLRSAGRFELTLRLLERARPEPPVLELGADPWLFTQLLFERGLDVVTAGQRRGVWHEDEAATSPQRVELGWAGQQHVLEHHLFNAERDRWPFDDGSFRTVLCMEVLEHLVYSPAHLLYEANRVLAERGTLILTTPNALAATKLTRFVRGGNVHGPYSGYGPHGRHNREFTSAEVEEALVAAGFSPEVGTANIAGYEADDRAGRVLRSFAGRAWPARRDHIFALAHKSGAPRLAFPASLYRSVDRDRMREERVLLPDE